MMLDRGADYNICDNDGKSPVQISFLNCQYDKVTMINKHALMEKQGQTST